jgi:hypothetical protein
VPCTVFPSRHNSNPSQIPKQTSRMHVHVRVLCVCCALAAPPGFSRPRIPTLGTRTLEERCLFVTPQSQDALLAFSAPCHARQGPIPAASIGPPAMHGFFVFFKACKLEQ